jgi:hypothetical protein
MVSKGLLTESEEKVDSRMSFWVLLDVGHICIHDHRRVQVHTQLLNSILTQHQPISRC